jgi:hypothetical protein
MDCSIYKGKDIIVKCVGVQHEANDEHHGYKTSHRGNRGIESPFLVTK